MPDKPFEEIKNEVKAHDRKMQDIVHNIPADTLKARRDAEAQGRQQQEMDARKNHKDITPNPASRYRGDDERQQNKIMLAELASEYQRQMHQMQIPASDTQMFANRQKMQKIVSKITRYAEMDATGTGSRSEAGLYDDILTSLQEFNRELEAQYAHRPDTDQLFNNTMLMNANMLAYFENQRDGNLEPVAPDNITVDTKGLDVKGLTFDYNMSKANVPLFPHDPSYKDIMQGELGDCFLLAPLSSVALTDPDLIRNAMRDNHDGTVTVRFWQRKMDENGVRGENDTYEPVYVRVDKVTPAFGSADGAVWVQTMERAYAVSGLYNADSDATTFESARYGRPVPPQQELDQLYKKYSKMPPSDWPSHQECPWLIGKGGQLHPYVPSYQNVEGGFSGSFLEHFLGPGYEAQVISMHEENTLSQNANMGLTIQRAFLDMYEDFRNKTGSRLTQDEYENIRDNFFAGNPDTCDIEQMTYQMLQADSKAQFPLEGQKRVPNDDNSKIAYLLQVDLFAYLKSLNNPQEQKNRQGGLNMTGFDKFVEEKQKEAEQKAPVNDNPLHPDNIRRYLLKSPELAPRYAAMVKQTEEAFSKIYQRNKAAEPYSGDYNGKELDLLNKVDRALKSGGIVTFGSDSHGKKGDSASKDGINVNHAFAVTGIEKETLPNGKELFFLRFRNPHGSGGRTYTIGEDGKVHSKAISNTNGEGLIELGDVFRELADVTINQTPTEQRFANHGIANPLSASDLSHCSRALESCLAELNAAQNRISLHDSEQYKSLKSVIQKSLSQMTSMEGRDVSALQREMNKIAKAANAYLKHCKDQKKSGANRARRVNAAEALIHMATDETMLKSRNPKETELQKAVSHVSEGILLAQGKTPEQASQLKGKLADKLQKDPNFQKTFRSMNFLQLYTAATAPALDLGKKYSSFAKALSLNRNPHTRTNENTRTMQ